jgi:hypothetical protein
MDPRDENVNDHLSTMNRYAYYEHNRNNKPKYYGTNVRDENEFYLSNHHQGIKDDIRLHRRESSDSSSSGIVGANLAFKPQYYTNNGNNHDEQNPESRVLMYERRRKFMPNTLQIDKRGNHKLHDTSTIVNYGRNYNHQQPPQAYNMQDDHVCTSLTFPFTVD